MSRPRSEGYGWKSRCPTLLRTLQNEVASRDLPRVEFAFVYSLRMGGTAQRRPRRGHPFPRLLHRRLQGGQVAHLAAGPGFRLAVEVELDVGEAAGGLPVGLAAGPEVAQEVRHGGGAEELRRAQRQAADGPQLLLELAGDAGVEGEVAGVVRARRQLVDQQAAVPGEEHLHGQHAGHPETLQDAAGDRHRLPRQPVGNGGRRGRDVEDVPVMAVLDHPEMGEGAVAPPGSHHGDLAVEIHEGLQDRLLAAEGAPGGLRLPRGRDPHLPLAVVPPAGRLQHRRSAEGGQGGPEVVQRADGRERGDREAGAGQEPLLAQPVLGGVEHGAGRPHGSVLRGGLGGGGGDVLELEGDHVHAAGEIAHRVEVVVGGLDLAVGDLAGGGVVVGGEGVDPVAHAPRGDGEHAAELTAAQDPDSRAGGDHPRRAAQGRVSSRTRRVCSATKSRSFSRSSGRVDASMRTASRAALAAPALPMASVPTGTPEGIWTIDSRESRPLSAWLWTGTPSTGRRVWAATMPGRWAAPPAPAMITWIPLSSAPRANSAIHSGVRWAETTWHSWGTPKRVSISSAWRRVSQSDLLPMMTLTRGSTGDRSSALILDPGFDLEKEEGVGRSGSRGIIPPFKTTAFAGKSLAQG